MLISVASRNGRRSLVGFGTGRDMEETELEEGEAYDYRGDNEEDEKIDPDVDLSYLDEKVQSLLGDFQKDFEGGVSAENLGAKYGGYGSFLPTYQRSPSIWSQPRTPQKVQSTETIEGDFQYSADPPGASFSTKHVTTSTSAAPSLVSRAPLLESSSKKKSSSLSSKEPLACNPSNEPLNRPNNMTDPRTLKVRLKIGSDNMAQKTAAIFSDLGFQLSSPDDSPIESGGLSPESRGSPDESPTHILKIMTSPVSKGLLLSPLPDILLHLTEKDTHLQDDRYGFACGVAQGSSSMLLDESTSVLGEGKILREKKTQPVENNKLIEKKSEIGKNVGNGFSLLPNEKLDVDDSERKEYVADQPNLASSNSKSRVGETAKGMNQGSEVSDIRKFKNGETLLADSAKEDSESIKSRDVNTTEKPKPKNISGDKVLEHRKEKVRKNDLSLSGKDGQKSKSNKIDDSGNVDYDGSKGKRELNGGTVDPPENKVKLKVTSLERGGKLPGGREQTPSEGKKKSKGSKNNGNTATVLSQESSGAVTSTSRDHKKSSRDSSSKNKFDEGKLPREVNKARETYKDIFGDEEIDQLENSVERPFKDRSKGYKPEVIEKQTRQFADKSKDKSSGQEIHHQYADKSVKRPNSKKVENPLTSESYQKAAQNVAPERNGIAPDTIAATMPPVVIEENWVACDRCMKWRLLPYGINPKDLPKKWLCNMSYWVPQMNSCNISEEETTSAVTAMNQSQFQIPPPENQNSLQTQPNGAAVGVTLPEVQNLNLKHQDHNYLSVPSGRNKKHGLKESADASNSMGPKYSSHSINKNQQASLKSRSVNDANQSPLDSILESKVGIRLVSKSNDSTGEKRRHKPKDKHKLPQDGGATSHSKMKSKREADQDGSTISKKIKTESFNNEEWNSDHVGVMGNSGLTASHGLLAKQDVCDTKMHGEYSSSKESKFDTKDNLPSYSKKPKELVHSSYAGSLDVGKLDNRDIAAKKRKVKEWQESQVYQSQPLTDASHHYEANISLEGTNGSEVKKGKKSRISKSEGKGSRKSAVDAREHRDRASQIQNSGGRDFMADETVEGKGYVDKDQQQSQYPGGNLMSQKVLDNMDASKKDFGYGFPSLAATSSSSKVSGSRKSKTNFQEAKGSPVESVSSSPMRIPDKGTSSRRNLLSKDDTVPAGFSTVGSLRRCSDGEGDGVGGHSGSTRKEKAPSIHRGSLESSMHDYQDREMNPTSGEDSKAPNDSYQVAFTNPHLANGGGDTIDQCGKRMELQAKERGHDAEQVKNHYGSNGSLSRKSGKGSSVRAKDKQKDSSSDVDKGKLKVSDSVNNQEALYPTKNSRNEADIEVQELSHSREGSMGGKYISQDKHGVKGGNDEKSCSGKKEYLGKWSNDGVRESQSLSEGNLGADVTFSAACSKDGKSNAQQSSLQDRVGEKFSHYSLSDRSDRDQLETTSRRGKSQSFQHSGDKQEIQTRCPRPLSSNYKGNGADLLRGDASKGGGDELKLVKLPRKPDNQTGAAHNSLKHSTPGRVVAGDLEGPSPIRKESSYQAANAALKEARDLKHSADRLKNSGSGLESTGLYFEAVLKFLHGASLLEPCNIESTRHGESQSVHVYSTTTSLCEFVAQEYERCKEMAFAALAYKCLEVACMRVVYFKHWSVNRDRHDLQTALHMVPPGESPSSSASDVDNLNNQGVTDKVPLARGVGSPQVVGNHVIAARNRPNFVRVLNFTHDVNSAMEASRKSLNAFVAASASLEESQYEGISSVKRALDFNFHDVQGLLRLVRLAMEAISS